MKQNVLYISFLIVLLFSCSTFNMGIFEKQRDQKSFDKYKDVYKDYIYNNIILKFKLEFDSDWHIKNEYRHFDRFQKKYASFFISEESEVLFIGFNEDKKIGIKATAERTSLSPQEYFAQLRNLTGAVISQYKPSFNQIAELTLKNIGTFHAEYEISLQNIVFKFRTIIFRKENHVIKIDIWSEKSKFESDSLYIDNILQSVDVLDEDQLKALQEKTD